MSTRSKRRDMPQVDARYVDASIAKEVFFCYESSISVALTSWPVDSLLLYIIYTSMYSL